MISTEYVKTGEDHRIIMHKTGDTRRRLRDILKRGVMSSKDDYTAYVNRAEFTKVITTPPRIGSLPFVPSDTQTPIHKFYRKPMPVRQITPSSSSDSTGTSSQRSLRRTAFHLKSQPLHTTDTPIWLPKPPPKDKWQTPEQLNLMVHRWIDPTDPAQPPPDFQHACPIAYHHIRGIMTGDGINDWVTRAAVLAEVDKVRVPMLEATITGEGEGGLHDLQALQAVHGAVSRLEVLKESRW